MTVGRLIRGRSEVISVTPDSAIPDVVRVLVDRRIGAVLVMEGDKIAGVLSERDIVRCLAERGGEALALAARDLMTAEVETTSPDESVDQAMSHMTRRRIRHLPVLDQGRLVGIVSIGDLVKARIKDAEREAASLKDYIRQA